MTSAVKRIEASFPEESFALVSSAAEKMGVKKLNLNSYRF